MKQTIALANSICAVLGIAPTRNLDGLGHGTVCLANDSLFSQSTFSQEVTTFAIGYGDPNRNKLLDLLAFIAPTRPGPRNAIITQYDETEPFEAVDYQKVKRAELGDFPTVKQRSSTKVTRKLLNRGLTIVLDNDQLKDKPNWQAMHTMWLIDLLTRASVIEAVALLTAAAATGNVVWDQNANPDLDIKTTNVQVLAPTTGFKANRALYGEDATLLREIAYAKQNNAGGYAGAQIKTDEQIATAIGVDRARTNAERYNTGTSKDTFIGSKVLLYSAQDAESPEDNSNIVRHVTNTDFGGGQYGVFIDQKMKKTFLTVENYEIFGLQHTSGLALVTAAGQQ